MSIGIIIYLLSFTTNSYLDIIIVYLKRGVKVKIVKTAKLKITTHSDKTFADTLAIYNKALSFFITLCDKEWHNLCELDSNMQLSLVEKLSHITNSNLHVKYDFSKEFYKFPSYMRRAAIAEALGAVSSHYSRHKNWLEKRENKVSQNKKFYEKPPTLNYSPKSFPVFYRKEMFKSPQEKTQSGIVLGVSLIKVYKDNDWKWIEVEYKNKELLSSDKYRFKTYKEHNPMLVKKGKKYFFHVPYEKKIKLNSTPLKKQKVIGVDLGLTNSAVCSCIDCNGTVIDRVFINQAIEKDHLKTATNRLSKAKRASGVLSEKPRHWRKINGLQKQIIQDTVNKIVDFARKHNADVIVFEYLGKMRIPKGFFGSKRLRAKLQYWAKCKIQEITCKKAHSLGIRYSKVLARGTSKYAYDGSGEVKRSPKKDIAVFANNKTYHADLSASYNIASRYFIRSILKPLSEMKRLQAEAKVPLLADRTNHTLSSLISLHEALGSAKNASASCIHDKEASSIVQSA
jgi:IS605 OrfB family transposase